MQADDTTWEIECPKDTFPEFPPRIGDRYNVLGESGRGGMGIVLKAFDAKVNSVVAVKIMRTDQHSAGEAAENAKRFRREWQVTASLSHPNIVTLFESSEFNGIPFFVMEYLEGRPLRDVIKDRGGLPTEEVVRIFGQLCDAMDYAHSCGVIHRDLKPSNLMYLNNGMLKITDFGVARTVSSDLTQIGIVVGTPRYKSPEEMNGFAADHRSDIFSLGIILHELLTGQHPFEAPTRSSVVRRILCSEPTWPSEPNQTVSPKVRFVVAKALAKFPENRYQSCRELINELREATAALRRPRETTKLNVASIRKYARPVTAAAAKAQRLHQGVRSAICFPKSAILRATLVIGGLVCSGVHVVRHSGASTEVITSANSLKTTSKVCRSSTA
ncbi:MAG TPA: serine/threonine-protein kinase [Terriglobia bacterium]|nr:serine/threonine-protein kinase [Terriglobia bacterium]